MSIAFKMEEQALKIRRQASYDMLDVKSRLRMLDGILKIEEDFIKGNT